MASLALRYGDAANAHPVPSVDSYRTERNGAEGSRREKRGATSTQRKRPTLQSRLVAHRASLSILIAAPKVATICW
eukprot:6208715-Pleurochrysis_carterae.AAC.5